MGRENGSAKFTLQHENVNYVDTLPVYPFQIPVEMIWELDGINYRTVMSETVLAYLDHLK